MRKVFDIARELYGSTAGIPGNKDAEEILERTFSLLQEIQDIHSGIDSNIISITNDKEQEVMNNLNRLIDEYGRHDLFIMKALLDSSNNWNTFMLVRQSFFTMDLEDGMNDYGSLAPDRLLDWYFMLEAVSANPNLYYEDADRLYDTVCNAIEQGDGDIEALAAEVRDIIWEPENAIEED